MVVTTVPCVQYEKFSPLERGRTGFWVMPGALEGLLGESHKVVAPRGEHFAPGGANHSELT